MLSLTSIIYAFPDDQCASCPIISNIASFPNDLYNKLPKRTQYAGVTQWFSVYPESLWNTDLQRNI